MNPKVNEYGHPTYYETLVDTLVWATGEAHGNLDGAMHAQRCYDDHGLSPHSPRYLINKRSLEFWRRQLSYWEPVPIIEEEALMADLLDRRIAEGPDALSSSLVAASEQELRAQVRARRAVQIAHATAQLERWIADEVDLDVTQLAWRAIEEATGEKLQIGRLF